MITAPYNFVPLNKEVFYPSWSEDVSYDVPFKDGESGEIDITITAKSPIFIRNHYQVGDEFYTDNGGIKISKEFCHFVNENGAKEFYIPGSSFKGMVRSVLEIMSFSKIAIDEERFKKPISVRDMTPKQYKIGEQKIDLYNSPIVGTANGIGLLKINFDGSGTIEDYTIEEKNGFKTTYGIRTIKYDQLSSIGYSNDLRKKDFEEKYKIIAPYSTIKIKPHPQAINRRYIANYDNSGKEAIVVLNSYIDGKDDGKKYEFVLCSSDKKAPIKVDKLLVDTFKSIYFDGNNTLGDFWLKKSKTTNGQKYGIPVFLMKSNKGKVQAIGLTQLFKLSYKKTIFEASKQVSNPNKLDLAETIFGTEKEKLALKGRVQFSHLKSTTERYEKEVDTILGSPNPTYYPNYIMQDGQNGKVIKYKTLMDNDAVISGWKRYPLHSSIMSSGENSDKEKVKTHFKPLQTDTVFKGKLRFHNLKKVEIGALLSAITFHGQSAKYMHNIGMAKPLGYGKIEIKLDNFKYFDKLKNENQKEYLDAFENEISKEIPNWRKSPQHVQLFAMASINPKSNKELAYQLLENPKPKYDLDKRNPEKNDFTGAKKAKEYLSLHSSNMPKPISQEYDTRSKKIEIQSTAPAGDKKEKATVLQTTSLNQLYEVYDGNILQVYNAFKNGHLVKYKIDEKELAKKLYADMKQDENLSKSNKPKDIERFEFLKQYL